MVNRGDYLRLWRSYLEAGKQAYKKYKRSSGEFTDKYRVTLSNFQDDDNVFYFLSESQGGGTPIMLHGKRFYEYYYWLWFDGRALQVWDKVGKTWRRVTGMAHPDKYVEGSHFIFKLRGAKYAKATVIEVSPVDGTMVLTTDTSDLKKENDMNREFETMTGCTVKIEKPFEKEVAVKKSDLEVVVKYQAIVLSLIHI